MRHRVYGKHLGRDFNERKALFKSLISSLLNYGTIQTTQSKAKAVKGLVDKVVNLAKDKKTQPFLQQYITNKALRDRLIGLTSSLKDRNSGYTTLVRLGTRLGDNAMMVRMSLINNESLKPVEKQVKRVEKKVEVNKKEIETKDKKEAKPVKKSVKKNAKKA